jgi:hypothetical protein
LSIPSLEFLAVGFEVREFLLSTAREVKRIKSQNNILLSGIIFERNTLLS